MSYGHVRVLVVDDSIHMRRLIRKLLLLAGFTLIAEAEDGVGALEQLRTDPFDLVITDWVMPHADGEQLLRAIRQTPAIRHLPVIVVSSAPRSDATAAGANVFIGKPFKSEEFIAEVKRLVQAGELRVAQRG